MTVRQMLNNLDSRELSEWMAYFRIENEPKKQEKKDEEKALAEKLKLAFKGKARSK